MIGAGLKAVYSQTPSPSAKGSIVAQGRLQPTKGILRLSALPGDRVEKVSAQAGSVVNQGD
ncbi:MAG: hypothetical protein ACKOAH_23740, partial [Pirellula sp.]